MSNACDTFHSDIAGSTIRLMFSADIFVGERVPDYSAIVANASTDNQERFATTEPTDIGNSTESGTSGRKGKRVQVT